MLKGTAMHPGKCVRKISDLDVDVQRLTILLHAFVSLSIAVAQLTPTEILKVVLAGRFSLRVVNPCLV